MPGHTHPGVHGQAAIGERQHGVQVELHDLRQLLGQQRQAQEELDEHALVGRRCPSEAGDQPPGLAGADELPGVVVRERSQPELRLADQLRPSLARSGARGIGGGAEEGCGFSVRRFDGGA